MAVPKHAFTIYGGCRCKAVRYKVEVPEYELRPQYPTRAAPSNKLGVRLPLSVIDHCNDCRYATGAVPPLWLLGATDFVSFAFIPCSTALSNPENFMPIDESQRSTWIPAAQVKTPGPLTHDTYYAFYRSSKERVRTFCGRCGTSLSYRTTSKMPDGWPDMLDIVLGSVDREYLEMLPPERHLWWKCGVDWVLRITTEGDGGLPRNYEWDVEVLAEN